MSQRGPEYAREWQSELVRARVGVTESHREPESKLEPKKSLASHF